MLGKDSLQTALPVAHRLDTVTFLLQALGDKRRGLFLVLDEQDTHFTKL